MSSKNKNQQRQQNPNQEKPQPKPPVVSKEDEELAKALGLQQAPPKEPEPETPPVDNKPEDPAKGGEKEGQTPEENNVPADPELAEIEKQVSLIPDPEIRQKTLEQLRKLYAEAHATKTAKAWVGFDNDLKTELPAIFEKLAKKHNLELTNRRIVVTFPNGKFSHTNNGLGKSGKTSGNGGSGREAPVRWPGKASDGKAQYDSPSAMATSLGLQVTGHSDMVAVFEDQGYMVTALPEGEKASDLVSKVADKDRQTRIQGLVKGDKFVIQKKAG